MYAVNMKKALFGLIFSFLVTTSLFSQALVTKVEAETGLLTGVSVATQVENSSGKYVTGFINPGDKVTVIVNVPATGEYNLVIRYRALSGKKVQTLYADEKFVANVSFPKTTDFEDLNAGSVYLHSGKNTLTIKKNWGFIDVDKFSIYTTVPNVFNISQRLIDPHADTAARSLYRFLLSEFGKKIISGSTDDFYDSVQIIAGKSPLLRAWDLASYSPMYPWNWKNGVHTFGPVDNHQVEDAINWYQSTGKKGIVAFHWHWGSPSGGNAGSNTFYTKFTSFDVSQAVISGTSQNKEILRDIDAIAVQLKKLSDAGVPVLWRPLHEAGGGWFWWGAKGSAPAKALWDIMYNRLTNFHGLHNLIWVWSSPEEDWYPGNNKVDIMAFDSYPGKFNYTTQKNVFDNLYHITGGKKIIAMAENGPIPDIDSCLETGATWSYFMTWNKMALSNNTAQHIAQVYANKKVITLENDSSALSIGSLKLKKSKVKKQK